MEDSKKQAEILQDYISLVNAQIAVMYQDGIRMNLEVDSGLVAGIQIDPPTITLDNIRLKL
jgi:hypothetical protein